MEELISIQKDPNGQLEYGILNGLVGYVLRRAHTAVFVDFARATDGFDISPGQLGLLILVRENPGLNAAQLAREVGLDKSTLTPFIARFEKRNLVRRVRSQKDKRAFQIELTDFGQVFVSRVLKQVMEHENRLQRGLGAQKSRRLIELLGEVEQILGERPS